MKSLNMSLPIFHLGGRLFLPWTGENTCVFATHADGHSGVSQKSSLSKNTTTWGMTGALSASSSRGIFLSYTYNRHKRPAAVGRTGSPMGDTRTGSGVNNPSKPPLCMSPSHRNKMCGQRAQTHSLYPPDDYTSFKSNNLDSFCFSWCHSSLEFIHLHFLWEICSILWLPFLLY